MECGFLSIGKRYRPLRRGLRFVRRCWYSGGKETQYSFPEHLQRFKIFGRLCDREVACSSADRQCFNRILRAVPLNQFSLQV